MPRNDQEAFNRYPEDLRTQLKQKKFAQEQYEAQKVRSGPYFTGYFLKCSSASETNARKANVDSV